MEGSLAHIATNGGNATPVPVRGRYIGRFLQNAAHAAFVGADLHSGRAVLIGPSLVQSALITGSNVTAICWAEQRQELRADIIAERLPLVPARPKPAPLPIPQVDDAEIIALVRKVGVDRVLNAAVAAENTNNNTMWLPPAA